MSACKQAAIITVRSSSTRLPNKALKPLLPTLSCLAFLIQRVSLAGFPVIVATSTDASDDAIVQLVEASTNARVFRGALNNRIVRWHDCFEQFGIESALLVDGDDLFYGYDIGVRAMALLESSSCDMVVNPDAIICGLFTYAISKQGLKMLFSVVPDPNTVIDMVGPIIEKARITTQEVRVKADEMGGDIRLTLDYPEDLSLFQVLSKQVPLEIRSAQLGRFLKKHPEITKINFLRQKGYLEKQARESKQLRETLNEK